MIFFRDCQQQDVLYSFQFPSNTQKTDQNSDSVSAGSFVSAPNEHLRDLIWAPCALGKMPRVTKFQKVLNRDDPFCLEFCFIFQFGPPGLSQSKRAGEERVQYYWKLVFAKFYQLSLISSSLNFFDFTPNVS